MRPQSAKGKGRRLQQLVRDALLREFPDLTLDDVRSTSMGAGGEDIQLSPAARKKFPFSVEAKARAKIAVYDMYSQATENCPIGIEPLLVIKADRRKPLVVLDMDFFLRLIKKTEDVT